ncbi:serine/threonine-protein kinase [Edaphobacter aggregans]|uniref:non-specific serine/threonine protein kinase n=1 Tax=Edaphobacter aggregans TaxID=570835 RepID=A0A3R9NTJ4_9BACT|nr:serine/threonine-protein kinase [Edaphobacter aggregans]RSL16443.1 serine/threonine-protein kinase [Edaphobacter aggregans]
MNTLQKIGRYEIIEELGRGAMGAVYRAKDPAMDRIVALKTIISAALASDEGGEFRERFFREARAAGALTHPGIVPVFDVGEHNGQPFLVMEYVNGWTLANVYDRGERFNLDRICEIGQKIAEALGYAHQRGVVHRDIKPANILLTSREAYGIERPKIADFGIAKLTESEMTMTGKMLGTPAFMPPEQFTGAQVDGRADIFSLGVVLYWLATGEQPFPGGSLSTVLYKVVHTEPIPPRKLNPALPARFESIIQKCMEKDPAARYQTGEELARELGELRTSKTATNTSITMPRVMTATGDDDATLFEAVPTVPAPAVVATPAQPVASTPASESKRNSKMGLVVAAGIVVASVSAGWYTLHARQSPPPSLGATSSAPAPAPTTTPAPMVGTNAVDAASPVPKTVAGNKPKAATSSPGPSVSEKKPSVTAPPNAGASLSAKSTPAAPKIEPLGFDPMTLDPKQNARLKIDASGMPRGLDFTVEMNGRIYSRNSGGLGQDSFVPPGVQEFRVSAKSGAVQQTSNTVSADFLQKKKHTLKVELRLKGQSASVGMPQGLYPDSQIVLTLK